MLTPKPAWELMSGTSFGGLVPGWAEISFPTPALEGDSYLSESDDIKVDGLRSDLVKTQRNRTVANSLASLKKQVHCVLRVQGDRWNKEVGGFVWSKGKEGSKKGLIE